MEKWCEYCKGVIPKGIYTTNITFGEEKGLIIQLISKKDNIIVDFGCVISYRVIEEGYMQTGVYDYNEIVKFKKGGFSNVIYMVENGEYDSDIRRIAGGYMDVSDHYHFVIITQNYCIDIITAFLPDIFVNGYI